MTIREALEAVTNDYTVRGQRSTSDVVSRIRHLLRILDGLQPLAEVTTGTLLAYAAARKREGIQGSTVNRELAVLRRGYTLLGVAWRAPGRVWRALPENHPREGFFEQEEVERVVAQLPAAEGAAIRFAYLTGWRLKSDVLPLRWSDVHGGEVRVRSQKTGERLIAPLFPQLREVVEERRAKVKGPYVFHRDGSRILWMYDAWLGACQRAGVRRHMHDLRRSAARNLVRAGVDRKTAMKLLGHKTESIFTRYQIVGEDDLRAAASRLSELLSRRE